MGTVKASRSIELKPQLNGQIVGINNNLIPGGRFIKGDTLLNLDPADYLLNLNQQENAVIKAQNNLLLEEGNQLVVKREFDLLDEQVSEAEKNLMLRQPQLSSLQTELSIARSQKEQAELNLARTSVKAPFNGVVQTLDVNIGTWVSTSTPLATLVGSDSYWVEVSIPEEQVRWVHLPGTSTPQGSTVTVFNPTAWGDDRYRKGELIQLLPGLESQGRMARLLIKIEDPLAMEPQNEGKPQLLINSYVRVVIEGKAIARAVELPREYLHNGNQLWVYGKGGKLEIREISVGFKNRDNVLVTDGLLGDERVVISDISTPVDGLLLRGEGDGSGKRSGRQGQGRVAAVDSKLQASKRGAVNEK